jgi:pimeloyl-ACP methyl ester carboxylesterase
LLHGQPAHSYLFRNVVAELGRVGRAIAIDWAGNGYSTPLTQAQFGENGAPSLQNDSDLGPLAPVTGSFFEAQATYLAHLVDALQLTAEGRRLIVIIHEVGGLGGFYYATTHAEDVKGVVFHDTWLNTCPDDLFAQGLCQQETLVPTSFIPAWAFCVYPYFECACTQFVQPFFLSAAAAQGLVVRPLDAATIAGQLAPYAGAGSSCEAIEGVIAFPWNITVPTDPFGLPEPQRGLNTHAVYAAYHAALRAWAVPKLWLIGSPPPAPGGRGDALGVFSASQITYAEQRYPNLTPSCIGFAGHLGAEDVPLNFAHRVLTWAHDQGLLHRQ